MAEIMPKWQVALTEVECSEDQHAANRRTELILQMGEIFVESF
jgi:hypothetical protein